MPNSPPATPPAERRALTVMFCDLVGSTALSARLDPEDLRDLLAAYQRHVTAVVEAAGGRVARYEGDGVLAYFGYPAASEDDAETAVRAGLELATGIRLGADRLSVRVGIATGVVVVGELMRSRVADNPPVVGETPNLAARLQALAAPGTVLVADATRRLTGRLFDYLDGGLRPVEGFAAPVRVWRAVDARVTSRFRALRSRTLPLLGRDAAMAALADRWTLAARGSGQVAIVSGEPGIGKSRLVQALAERVRQRPATVVRLQCSPHHESSLLHPILERLRRATRAVRTDAAGAGVTRLKRLLGRGVAAADGGTADGAVALLADLMGLTGLPAAGGAQGPRLDAQRKRELLLEALAGILDRLAQVRPLLLVLEDTHWIDPTSLQLLDLVVGRLGGWPMLLVVTCRPELQPDWRSRSHVARIKVEPIGADDAEKLVRHVPGGADLPGTVVRGIVARSDGVPLFIEELTKAVVDAAAPPDSSRSDGRSVPSVPSSLHTSLMARLDRIGRPRNLARIAAALGRQFTLDQLSAVVEDRHPEDLRGELHRLIDAELMVPVASPSSGTYAFRHALIQDAAYGSLLRSERRALHGRIAAAIEGRFPEIAAGQPEIVAAHCTKAELWEPAVRHWLGAGHRAVRGWALAEAAEHYTEGIRIAGNLPASPERQRLELDLHMALGPVTMGIRGYAAEESLEVYRRAEPLVQAVGDISEQLMLTMALYNVHYGRAELTEALAAAEAYRDLAERHGTNLGRAYGLLAQTHAAMAAFGDADREFQRSLEVFARAPEELSTVGVFGSQHVISLAFRAGVLFAFGRAEEGQASVAESVALARRMEHPLSIALALVTELLTPIPGGLNPDLARAEEAVRFCGRHRLGNFETWAEFARGAIVARRGDPRQALEIMGAAVEQAEAMSSRLFRPVHLATLASAHARLGELDQALLLVEQALATASRTGERRAGPALHRLRGELLLAIGRRAEAEHELRQALAVARSQGARAEHARAEEAIARLAAKRP